MKIMLVEIKFVNDHLIKHQILVMVLKINLLINVMYEHDFFLFDKFLKNKKKKYKINKENKKMKKNRS